MTTTLAFDTSQQWCSVAVSQDGKLLAHHSRHIPSGHSEILLPQIINTLEEASLGINDVDLIAAITGPGSFTGLRVSIAAAQGLSLALSKPVIGIDIFMAYASCIKTEKNILVVIDSQKQDIYCQLFSSRGIPIKEPQALDPSEIAPYAGGGAFALTGTATEKVKNILNNYELLELTSDEIIKNISLIAHKHEHATSMTIHPFYLKEAITGKTTKAL